MFFLSTVLTTRGERGRENLHAVQDRTGLSTSAPPHPQALRITIHTVVRILIQVTVRIRVCTVVRIVYVFALPSFEGIVCWYKYLNYKELL